MSRLVDLDELIDAVESTTWYHIDDKGELVEGANSALHTPLFKAEDIFKVLEEAKVASSEEKTGRFIRESDVYALFNPRGVAQLHVGDIDTLPRVEYKAPRAKWKLGNYGKGTCSHCNFTQNGVWDYDHHQRFCGVCGAEMELEDK